MQSSPLRRLAVATIVTTLAITGIASPAATAGAAVRGTEGQLGWSYASCDPMTNILAVSGKGPASSYWQAQVWSHSKRAFVVGTRWAGPGDSWFWNVALPDGQYSVQISYIWPSSRSVLGGGTEWLGSYQQRSAVTHTYWTSATCFL